jgi:hypothetical protein
MISQQTAFAAGTTSPAAQTAVNTENLVKIAENVLGGDKRSIKMDTTS